MYTYKHLVVINGVLLGLISVIAGNVPIAVAQISGMTAVGSPVGYLLNVLVIAWLYKEDVRKSFILSFLTIFVAFFVFYLLDALLRHLFGVSTLVQFPATAPRRMFLETSVMFVQWSGVADVFCALASAAVRVMYRAKSKLLTYGILVAVYFFLLYVTYLYRVRTTMTWCVIFEICLTAGVIFELAFPFALTSIMFGFGLKTLWRRV